MTKSPTVKTAISLDRKLFERAEKLARELRLSRSGLFSTALQDYMRRLADRNLLERLNAAYAAPPSDDEQSTLRKTQRHAFKTVAENE